MQPRFLSNRDIYEQREKKAKIYTASAVSCLAVVLSALSRLTLAACSLSRPRLSPKFHILSSVVSC